ncbi:MAG: hypothetical protein ABIO70_04970 [Pseudomonadota bacterium]
MVIRLPLLSLLLVGCGPDPCPDGSMLDGAEGLVVTAEEHGAGWGQAACFGCHAATALHRTGCTPDVDLEAIQAQVEAEGEAGCATCHGDNGVEVP